MMFPASETHRKYLVLSNDGDEEMTDEKLFKKSMLIILAIITFPLHVIITGTMIWACHVKEIIKG